jgi:hypothetical protein
MLAAEPWLPQRLSKSVELLAARAPSLARLALSAFSVVRGPPPRPVRANVTPRQALIVFAAAIVIAAVFAFAVIHPPPPSRARPTPVTELASSAEGRRVCAAVLHSDECRLVHLLEAELEVRECARARSHAAELTRRVMFDPFVGREGRIAATALEQRISATCPIETAPSPGSTPRPPFGVGASP